MTSSDLDTTGVSGALTVPCNCKGSIHRINIFDGVANSLCHCVRQVGLQGKSLSQLALRLMELMSLLHALLQSTH